MYAQPKNTLRQQEAAAPTPIIGRLAGLSVLILETVYASPFTTPAEKARCIHKLTPCQDADQLGRWYANLVRELAHREEASEAETTTAPAVVGEAGQLVLPSLATYAPRPTAPIIYATGEQKADIIRLLNHLTLTRAEKTTALLGLNLLTVAGAAALLAYLTAQTTTRQLPSRSDLTADRRDYRHAARFRPTTGLTFSELLTLQAAA